MDFLDVLSNLIDFIKNPNNAIYLYLTFVLSITFYHILLYFLKDRKAIKKSRLYVDPIKPQIEQLETNPLVNIIVPAWKEGELFKGCLECLRDLTYSNLKIIVIAGGNEKTLSVAESFKKYENFLILRQLEGGGKLKAFNDALKYVSEGLIFFIDADVYLDNLVFIKMLYKLINENQEIVVTLLKPHKSQLESDLVRHIYINRSARNKFRYLKYLNRFTPCSSVKYSVIKSIKKFPEKELLGDGIVMARAVFEKGQKIFRIKELVESFNFPDNIPDYFNQNVRWIENNMYNLYKNKKIKLINKFFYLLASIYLLIYPFLIIIDLRLFFFGILLYFAFYISKIRNYVYFIKIEEKSVFKNTQFKFFIKTLFYIYLDVIINIYTIFELIFYSKNYKKRKNIVLN
ncbi:MAG: glycosyltransferase, partial [Promethearchaeota archaeon]